MRRRIPLVASGAAAARGGRGVGGAAPERLPPCACRRLPPTAACPGEGSNHPGRCLRRAKHGFWGAGQPLARCRGAPGPRGRVPKPQSTRLTRLELERLFFALIFAKKPQATLKNSIPLQNLKFFFGLEALSRRTRLLRLENQLIYLRGSVGGLIYRRRAAGRSFKRRACRGAE